MKTDFLIIGGGVAGLSAANRLAEKGADVTLLESGTYPAHKICGEFLSPEALPILETLDIVPSNTISGMTLVLPKTKWSMTLPKTAGTISRYALDDALAKRAIKKGAKIQTSALVDKIITPNAFEPHFTVVLTNGDIWTSPTLLLSAGRLANTLTNPSPPKFCYIGAKAHFKGIDMANELQMHLLPGAYFGLGPLEGDTVNVAGIIACKEQEAKNPRAHLTSFFKRASSKHLRALLQTGEMLYDDYLTSPVPEFGLKSHPGWKNTFLIGDAAGVIPPATGDGLAMGLSSGIMAAEYAIKGQADLYLKHWKKEYKQRIAKGMLLHRIFLSSFLSTAIPLACRICPPLPGYLFRATRG